MTSRYRGVCWNRKNRRWQAAINRAGQYIYLGSFVSEEDAAKAFDRAAVKLRGHSTKINFDFGDYEEELKWHEQTSRADGTTDAILKDPKMLRGTTNDKTAGYTNVPLTPPIRRQPLPAHFPNTPMDAAGFTQVITQQQTQRLTMSVPFQPYFPTPQMMGMNRTAGFLPQVMPSSNALFPGVGSLELSQPPARAATNQNPVKVPPGATQTQFFHGAGNAFALAYAKNNSPGISVLVFDGHVMNDNGVFSTMEDAAQACKSLLSIIEKMQNHDRVAPETPAKIPVPTPPPQLTPTPPPVQADSLPARSPFEVRPGKAPDSIQADNNDQKWFPHDAQPAPGTAKVSYPGKSTTSIQEQMGSLLNMSNNQFESLTKGAGGTTAPVQTGETRQETRMSFSAASVSLLSRSLEDLVCVLNQSGQIGNANSGSIKREGEDVTENGQTSLTTPSAIDLRLEEKSLTLNGPPMSIAPFVYGLQNNTEEGGQMQNAGQDAVLGKRKMDAVQDNENAKKAREG